MYENEMAVEKVGVEEDLNERVESRSKVQEQRRQRRRLHQKKNDESMDHPDRLMGSRGLKQPSPSTDVILNDNRKNKKQPSPRRNPNTHTQKYNRKVFHKEAEILDPPSFRKHSRSQSDSIIGTHMELNTKSPEQSAGESRRQRGMSSDYDTFLEKKLSKGNPNKYDSSIVLKNRQSESSTTYRSNKLTASAKQNESPKYLAAAEPTGELSGAERQFSRNFFSEVDESDENVANSALNGGRNRIRNINKVRKTTQKHLEARKKALHSTNHTDSNVSSSNTFSKGRDVLDGKDEMQSLRNNRYGTTMGIYSKNSCSDHSVSSEVTDPSLTSRIITPAPNTQRLERNKKRTLKHSNRAVSAGTSNVTNSNYDNNDDNSGSTRKSMIHTERTRSHSSHEQSRAFDRRADTQDANLSNTLSKIDISNKNKLISNTQDQQKITNLYDHTSSTSHDRHHRDEAYSTVPNDEFGHVKDDGTITTNDATIATEESGGRRLQRNHSLENETFRNTASRFHPCNEMDYDDETTVFDANTINSADDEDKLRKTQRADGYSYLMKEMKKKQESLSSNNSEVNGRLPSIASMNVISHGSTGEVRNYDLAKYESKKEGILKMSSSSRSTVDRREISQVFDEDSKNDEWDTKSTSSFNHQNALKQGIETSRIHKKTLQSGYFKSKSFSENVHLDEDKSMKIAVGITAAATVGALVLGPVGLLLGAASVGVGVGTYMNAPASQRANVNNRAQNLMSKATRSAIRTGEAISNSCAVACDRAGFSDAVPSSCINQRQNVDSAEKNKHSAWLDNYRSQFDNGTDLGENGFEKDMADDRSNGVTDVTEKDDDTLTHDSALHDLVGGVMGTIDVKNDRRRRVACLRKTRIIPVNQIHALNPSSQPKAWLDVMACGHTSMQEKNEAMEEILILAKDKNHAQMFLEEGLLDSLMYILSSSFQKLPPPLPENIPRVCKTPRDGLKSKTYYHAKLAANCCVALGKAHCAVVHTEGDLLLMSAYNRGAVPVERQLAQMLHEIPHNSWIIGTNVGEADFVLTEMTMQQAEEMAKNIKALMDGRLEWNYNDIR